MSRDKQIEEMALTEVDILANDINQHCPDLKENYCGDMHCVACLAHALTAKGYRKASDVARGIFEEIEEIRLRQIRKSEFFRNGSTEEMERKFYEGAEWGLRQLSHWFAELKKKYTVTDTNVGCKLEEGK